MSVTCFVQKCPLCGQAVGGSDPANPVHNHEFNFRTRESYFSCGNPECRFRCSAELKEASGKHFWVETTWYPMKEDGKVLRPMKSAEQERGTQRATPQFIKDDAEFAALVDRQDNDDIEAESIVLKQDRELCDAMICEGRYLLPSGNSIVIPSNLDVADAEIVFYEPVERIHNGEVIPKKLKAEQGEMMFIKNVGYDTCGLPGVVWDDHADNRDDQPGWLCAWHSGSGDWRRIVTLAECEEHAAEQKKEKESGA